MSKFKSYTDRDGNKVKIGDFVEINIRGKEVERIGKVVEITNETFSGITIMIEGHYDNIRAQYTRKLVPKGDK